MQTSLRGYSDVIVAKVDPTGSALVYSTYLGGTGYATPSYYSREFGLAIAADAAGNAYVTGLTESTDFPVVNALFRVSGNGYDAFITKLAPTGPLVYSTYLGSAGSERGDDIEVDAAGSVYITGNVAGPVPLKDPIQEEAGEHDGFVTKLNPAGTALDFSTMLGGSGQDHGRGVAVDAAGAIYVVGGDRARLRPHRLLPPQGPVAAGPGGGFDGFVTKIALGGSARVTIEGATFFTDGSSTRSAAPGASVSLFANSAAAGFAYRLVLARDGCNTTVAVLNATRRYANNASGFIGATRVTIPAGTPAGTYELCFKSEGGLAVTGPATITIG